MKRNLSFYIVFVPIMFVLISISSLTFYNISKINQNGDNQIKQYKNDYLVNEKTRVYNRIHYFANIIKDKTNEYNKLKKDEIKEKVHYALDLSERVYSENKNLSKKEMKNQIIKILGSIKSKNPNAYYSIVDLKTNKVILNKQKKLLDRNLNTFLDSDGRNIFSNNYKYDDFITLKLSKNDNDKKVYEKIVYFKEFKKLDLVIIYGEYIDEINEEIRKKIIEDIKYTNFENNSYIFIIKILNVNGGKNYGKVLLHQAKPQLEGKVLSSGGGNINFENYRKDYLFKLKNSGEGFVTYYYSRPDSNKLTQKMSYFYLQKDWNWALGSGFYFDDLDKNIENFKERIKKQTKENVNAAIILSLILTVVISIILFFISNKIKSTIDNYSKNLNNTNEKLLKQRDIFETLFEKSSDGRLILDKNGLIKNCNDAFVKILGYEDKQLLVGKNYLEFSPEKQFDDVLSDLKSNFISKICFEKNVHNYDWLFLKKDRKIIYCDVMATNLELNEESIIYCVIRDITDKKELEEKTKKQQLMLSEESKKSAMGEMITMIAHQWRQPLNNVNLLIHFVRDNFDKDRMTKEELKSVTLDMKNQIEYMSKTIDDFTNFINPKKEFSLFCVEDAFDKTLNIIKGQFSKKSINIIKNIDEIFIKGIENEFMQVLLNILNNAKDSLENVEGERFIFINAKSVNNKVTITIKDNAGGIPPSVLSRIFEPYFTTKHKKNGTGIGLYMSEEIIRQYKNGSLVATNEHYYYEDKFYEGAMFTISLDLD